MKEVKSPKKPLIYYYGVVLLVLLVFNLVITPLLLKQEVTEVDYGTIMSMTESKNIGQVQVEDQQIRLYRQGRKERLSDKRHGRPEPYRTAV